MSVTFHGTYTANGGADAAAGTVAVTDPSGSTTTASLDGDGAYSSSISAQGHFTVVETITGVAVRRYQVEAVFGATVDTGRDVGPVAHAGGGGGGAAPIPGSPVVRAFPFAFDTPGLATGAAVYTPTVGDVLLDARISILTAWNGTTPQGDIGTFQSGNFGFFSQAFDVLDMTFKDLDVADTDGLLQGFLPSLAAMSALTTVQFMLGLNAVPPTVADLRSRRSPVRGYHLTGVFTAAHPLQVCVSQNGWTNGGDPGSTQGSAILYLVTATPLA